MGCKKKVLVCGARFGQFYMEAVRKSHRYELAGILARGSDLVKACAEKYQTRLYTNADDVPEDIDMVCIAVRTGVLGGSGTELTLYFIRKGIPVVLEQPVHYQDLTECYRAAYKYHVAFHVGDLYMNLLPVKRFVSLANLIEKKQKMLYVNVDMATQVSYPFVRILTALLGKARRLEVKADDCPEEVFRNVSIRWNDVTIMIRVQNQEGARVADNCMHLLFQITAGFNSGSLNLSDADGILFWRERMEIPDIRFVPGDLADDITLMSGKTAFVLSANTGSYNQTLQYDWVAAVEKDIDILEEMRSSKDCEGRMRKEGEAELAASKGWKTFMQALGYPQKVEQSLHNKLNIGEIFSEYRAEASMQERYDLLTSEEVSEAVCAINTASLQSIYRFLQEQGFFTDEKTGADRLEITAAVPMNREFDFVIDRWLMVLEENQYIRTVGGKTYGVIHMLSEHELEESWNTALRLWRERLGPETVGRYLYTSAMSLAGQMKGEIKANYLLYPEGRNDIANDLYRNTMIAWYMNRVLTDKIAVGCKDKKIRVLEVGAGTGATSDVVIQKLKEYGLEENLLEYCYTDLSPYFLVQAKERYSDAAWLVTRTIDINRPLKPQGIEEHAYDVIIAAGVINNVDDTVRSLQYLKNALCDDGTIYMSEAVGESVQMLVSQVFMMKKAEDARGKANTTFMTQKMWMDVFADAELSIEDIAPDRNHKLYALNQQLFVLKPEKEVAI